MRMARLRSRASSDDHDENNVSGYLRKYRDKRSQQTALSNVRRSRDLLSI